jgi:hypothetical protein
MKIIAIALLLSLISSVTVAQKSKKYKTMTVNTINAPVDLYRSHDVYPAFLPGKVNFKDGSTVEAVLNYNHLLNQLLFISEKGDTLALKNPDQTANVEIGTDTFYFFEDVFLRKMSHFGFEPEIYLMQASKYITNEKKGAYGSYSLTSAANSNNTYTDNNQHTTYIAVDENMIFRKTYRFYLKDKNDKYIPSTKAALCKLFPKHEDKILDYVKSNKIDLNKMESLYEVLFYIRGL